MKNETLIAVGCITLLGAGIVVMYLHSQKKDPYNQMPSYGYLPSSWGNANTTGLNQVPWYADVAKDFINVFPDIVSSFH